MLQISPDSCKQST